MKVIVIPKMPVIVIQKNVVHSDPNIVIPKKMVIVIPKMSFIVIPEILIVESGSTMYSFSESLHGHSPFTTRLPSIHYT